MSRSVRPGPELLRGPDAFAVEGRVIWVTGASRGIGAALAVHLASAGAHLVLQSRSAADLDVVRAKAEAEGVEVLVACGSVTDEDLAGTTAEAAVGRWGRIDGLVNNAGISPVLSRSEELSLADWRQICEINLTGAFVVTRAAARSMLECGAGSIVNMSSVHGRVGAPRLTAYAASKGGLDMLTRSLAVEWADRGVRVNAVAPGYVATDMTEGLRAHERWSANLLGRIPVGRFATPQDVLGAVHFLLSDASAYMTGAVVEVDGGWGAQ